MLSIKYRLKKQRDIKDLFLQKKAVFGRYFIVNYKENKLNYPRFAFILSKKNIKKAVDRNYFKRVLRHIVYQNLDKITAGVDVAIVVKPSVIQAEFCQLEEEIEQLFKKIRL